jgi:anthranilate phosphoribosyltransferase
MTPTAALAKLTRREDLSRTEARVLFDALVVEDVEPAVLGAVLAALATKGETIDEIVGTAESLRARVHPVQPPTGTEPIDTCGTGGDGKPIFNVSSTVAIVAAAAGATVAKHGNRSNARPSGSAEVLAALGVNIDADVAALERCLQACGVAFLYAPRLHPAMRHAVSVRRALGMRTIFNLVGPLTNPAGVRAQVLGVNRPELVPTMLAALRQLGCRRALVVHGCEGLCDLSIAGPSRAGTWDGERETIAELDCSVVSATPATLDALHVGGPDESAAMIRGVLAGEPGPPREMVVFNTAAALWVAGVASDWADGAGRARAAIDSGAAAQTLERWAACSQAISPPGD